MFSRVTIVVVFAFAATSLLAATDVYEWRDADGVEHMSDTPPANDEPGVVLLRVNGKDVNTFDLDSDNAAEGSELKRSAGSSRQAQPRNEEDCAAIHGRPCNWDEHWRRYASDACARQGGVRCNDDAFLRREFDPRRRAGESEFRHLERHAARHGGRAHH